MAIKLHQALALLAPFALVALYHHMRFATTSLGTGSLSGARRGRKVSSFGGAAIAVGPLGGGGSKGVGATLAGLELAKLEEAAKKPAVAEAEEDMEAAEAAEAEAEVAPEDEELEQKDADEDEPPEDAAAAAQPEEKELKPRPRVAEPEEPEEPEQAQSQSATGTSEAAAPTVATSGVRDVAAAYPAPTLSSKRLLDSSENWLPVPDAESEQPSDLAWRSKIPAECKVDPASVGAGRGAEPAQGGVVTALTTHPLFARIYNSALDTTVPKEFVAGTLPKGCVCPPGRRPYHTILTAQASVYQRWQTLIFYHHFRKAQRLNPCTEMTGFTRLLASNNGDKDDLMDYMPTVTVGQLGFDKTRGFQVINRPWTMLKFLEMPEWNERIVEDYVYIAETDHLLLTDIPNRATPKVNVAFFFPYMSPVPAEQANVVKRYFDGDHLTVQPVGPSPAIVHVDNLKKLTPLWYKLSVDLKHDTAADRAFGWVLEMWGYSIACARVGIKHYVWQQIQIEPSSTWHQNVTVEEPYIYHYTFGVEYSSDGIPMVGTVGEWSLDKRHYFGSPPPKELQQPPECAQECAWVWWRMFNEATRALGNMWHGGGGNTRTFRPGGGSSSSDSGIGIAVTRAGPWVIDDQHRGFLFHVGGRLSSPWGAGKWSVSGDARVKMEVCGSHELTFNSAEKPTSFTIGSGGTMNKLRGGGGVGKEGKLDDKFRTAQAKSSRWEPSDVGKHTGVQRLLGTGPWAWAGISTMAFLDEGVLVTPWGQGTWHADREADDAVFLVFAGATHRVVTAGCHKFSSRRESDGQKVDGWIQLGGPNRGGCPGRSSFF